MRYSNLQSTPNQRRLHRLIIRILIQHKQRIRIEPLLAANLPQLRAIQVRRRDPKQREVRDREGQLQDNEEEDDIAQAPLAGEEEAAHRGRGWKEGLDVVRPSHTLLRTSWGCVSS